MEKRFIAIVLVVSVFALSTVFFDSQSLTTAAVINGLSLKIKQSSCLLNNGKFNVCIGVNWDAPQNYYVKAQISGGESLSSAQKFYAKEFTYCQDIEKKFGSRVANVYLHDEKGRWVKFIKGYKVECSGDSS